jgi:hypothetical protein
MAIVTLLDKNLITHERKEMPDQEEEFDSVRLKRRVKQELETIQERLKQMEGLHKRPPLSDVVMRLIELASEAAESPAGLTHTPSQYSRKNSYHHDLLEIILEGESETSKQAITKNLRAFALTTFVAAGKTEQQIDHDLETMIKHFHTKAENAAHHPPKKRKNRRVA